MIELKNIKLNIKNIDILNDISFNIYDNSVVCLLGNKHSGKSAVLKVIAGIYNNYYGEVLCDGKDLNDIKEIKVDLVHDSRERDEDITVLEYLEFYGSIYNTFKKEKLLAYIDSMLKKFSLISYKYTSINMLDNENYKLLDLIRVSINNSQVILFDNLFSSENLEFNDKLLDFIKTLIGKKTLIFASRSLNYIESIAEYIGIIEAGTLIAYGKKNEIYKKAELSNRIEIELIDGVSEAVDILKNDENVANVVYEDNLISFSIVSDVIQSGHRNEVESKILNKLVSAGIKVYSFKKQRVRFEQLFGRLKD